MKDIDDKLEYLRGFIKPGNGVISVIAEANSRRNDVQPEVEPEVGSFLSLLVRLMNAKAVLELGSSNGSSGLWFLEALRITGGHLTTIDSKHRLHLEALENYRTAGYDDIVTAISGDAEEIIQQLDGPFDIVFQDCGKYLYPQLLDRTVSLLKEGGLIIAEDTLFAVEDSVRPNLGRHTDLYNRMVFARKDLYSSILPVGHGLTLSYKI